MNERVILPDSGIDLEELRRLTESFVGVVGVIEPIVKHLKVKKDIPTVIEYQGRRYVLDHARTNK